MNADTEKRVRLYIAQGYAPSKIDAILVLPKGETRRLMKRLWSDGVKV